jgi:Family of unknown function (DUF6166)
MKYYIGERTEDGCVVEVIDRDIPGGGYALDPRVDLRNHSVAGYEWGFSGNGSAQLALALAADVLGDDGRAQEVYQRLKLRVVAGLPDKSWTLSEGRLPTAIEEIERNCGRSP